MEAPVVRVVIAGGGTAGWMAAAALVAAAWAHCSTSRWWSPMRSARSAWAKSTIPTIRASTAAGASTSASSCAPPQATFKLGISFENWGDIGDRYIHSFGMHRPDRPGWASSINTGSQPQAAGLRRRARRLLLRAARRRRRASSRTSRAVEDQLRLSSRRRRSTPASCARMSEANGVKRVEGKIARVEQHPRDRLHRGAGAGVRRRGSRATCSSTAPDSAAC